MGDYDLLEEIARGGMGIVYKARQRSLNRIVALKRIAGGQLATAQQIKRFRAEAQAVASLQHPNIVSIHEVGEQDGQPFFSMDFVAGRSLAAWVRDGPLPARVAARYLQKIAAAVQYAHECGIIHRDLKPSNVLIDQDDEPRITDFGLAKRLTSPASDLTLSGQVMGSPSYLSPEQARGKGGQVGPASDIYSLGAILYHLLTGRPPFQAETLTSLLRQVSETETVRPRLLNPSIPKDLETICLKCLEKDPARRYGSALALAEDLGRYLQNEPILARPVGWLGRSWRWCVRKPALAGAIGACLGILALGVTGIAWQWRRAAAGEREARLHLYAADMGLVQQSLEENNFIRARALLDRHVPRKGQVDLRGWEWRFLHQRCKGDELESIRDHEGPVTAAEFSPDGTWFASGGWDGKVIVRETSSKRLLATLSSLAEKSYCRPFCVSPAGAMMAVHVPGGIDIWDTAHWRLLRKVEDGRAPMAFSGDGSLLAARCGQYSMIRIWKTDTWESELREAGYVGPAYFDSHMEFLPGSRSLVVYGANFRAEGLFAGLLDLSASGKQAVGEIRGFGRTIPGTPGVIRGIALSPDGRQMATADRDGRIVLWSVPDARHLGEFKAHQGDVFQAVFSPNGQRLASVGGDFAVRLWDVATRTNVITYRGHQTEVWSVAFSPDGHRIITAGREGACNIWDATLDKDAGLLPIGWGSWHRRGQCWLAGDGSQLGTFVTNRVPELRTLAKGIVTSPPRRLLPHLTQTTSISMDARHAVVQATETAVEIWDLPHQRRIGVPNIRMQGVGRHSFIVSPDNRFHYEIARSDGLARLWDLTAGELVKTFDDGEVNAFGMAFSPDSRLLDRGATNNVVELWDTRTRQTLHRLRGHQWHFGAITFSPDGLLLATGSWSSEVIVWETATGNRLQSLLGHQQGITWMGFSPDGKSLLTAADENVLRVWHLATGQEVARLPEVWCCTLSADGSTLAVWFRDKLRLIYVPTLSEIDQAR